MTMSLRPDREERETHAIGHHALQASSSKADVLSGCQAQVSRGSADLHLPKTGPSPHAGYSTFVCTSWQARTS